METKHNKKPFLKRIKWKHVILLILVLGMVTVGTLGTNFVWQIYKDTEEFDATKLTSGEPSKMYAKATDGNDMNIYTFGGGEEGKRENVTYDDLPQVLIDAVIAAEDSRFFEHDGFDLPRMVTAAFGNLKAGGITSGGSTITQQLIKKSYFPAEEQTFTRKFSEIFLAMEASKEISKEEVLELYLNKIYFGRTLGSIGIAAASRYYFGKDVSELTLPEAALMAGTLNSPAAYDPFYNLEGATSRRNRVLTLMVEHEYITQEEADDAKAVKVENLLVLGTGNGTIQYQSYIDIVISELKAKGYDPEKTEMEIYTFLDTEVQTMLDEVTANYGYEDAYMQVGASVQNTRDGRIIGVIGGRYNDQTTFGTNRATLKKQPGSSLKPVTDYGAAFEFAGWSTGHYVDDIPYNKNNYNPNNYNHAVSNRKMSISEALLYSWNLPAVWSFDHIITSESASYKDILDMYERFGVDTSADRNDAGEPDIGIAYSLGGWAEGTSPIEMASVYATIVNNGIHVKSHAIDYIKIVETGEIISFDDEAQNNAQHAVTPETAFMIRDVMEDYAYSGGYGKSFGHSQIYAKTGTSNHSSGPLKGKSKDNWLAAYNPDFSVAVWMGYDEKDVKELGLAMDLYSARYFCSEVFDQLTDLRPLEKTYPEAPEGVYQAKMVKGVYPYKSPSASTPSANIVTAWFTRGNGPGDTTSNITPNNLSSFDAHLDSNNKIAVTFTSYDPIEAVTNARATDGTQIHGRIRYGVEVVDMDSGQVVYSTMLDTNSATLSHTVTGSIKVTGFYTFENAPSLRSNTISKTLTVSATNEEGADTSLSTPSASITYGSNGEVAGNTINYPVGTTELYLTLNVTRKNNSNSTVKVLVNGNEYQTLSAGQTSTSIKVQLVDSNGTNISGNVTITVIEIVDGQSSPSWTGTVSFAPL